MLREQEIDDLLAGDLIEIAGRLVRDQDRGVGRQRPGQRHALLFTAGQLGRVVMQPVAEADRCQFLRGTLCRLGMTSEFQRHRDIFQRRHGRNQMERLEHDPDLAAAKARQRVLVEGIERGAVDHHLSAIRTLQPRHYHQQCGFPRARRADQADRFTRRHAQADIFEDMYARRARAQREIDVRNGNGVRLEAGQRRGFDETVHGSVIWHFGHCGRGAGVDVRAHTRVGSRPGNGGNSIGPGSGPEGGKADQDGGIG